jgi:TDG/mug DNA glycosylase family protein
MILPDYLTSGLDVVFCGTAAGRVSAQKGHYYANPGNRFWSILAEVGLTPRRLAPDDDRLVNGYGLGLTDLAKTVYGQDCDIPHEAWDIAGLFDRLKAVTPRVLAFTSLTAARLALQDKTLGCGPLPPVAALPKTTLWALPSPSGLARSHFSAEPWKELAIWVRESR